MKRKVQGKKSTYVCIKHNYTRRSVFGGLCPICREELKSVGSRWRIHSDGDFEREERKTKELSGRKTVVTQRQRTLKREERLKNQRHET